MSQIANRNITLDYVKFFLIMLIISGHSDISTYGLPGWLVADGFARVTVPLFLIINGYYFANIVDDKAKVKKYIKRLLIIYIAWTAIYFPFIWHATGGGKKLILINFLTGYYHLWYIASLIGAAFLIYLTRKYNKTVILIVAYILFFIGYVIQKIYFLDIHIYMYPTIVRTFLFMGFPLMFIGYYIKKNNLEAKAIFKSNGMIILTVFLFILLLLESAGVYFFKRNDSIPVMDEIFFVSPFLCPLLFFTVLKYSQYKPAGDGYMSKMVSAIYFIHILVIFIVTGSPYNADIIMYPIYFFLSVLFSSALLELNKRIKIFL